MSTDTISSNATPTVSTIPIEDGNGTNYFVGELIKINGEIVVVTQIELHQTDDGGVTYYDRLTISPSLSVAPSSGDTIVKGFCYYPAFQEGKLISLGVYVADVKENIATGRAVLNSIDQEDDGIHAKFSFVGLYSFELLRQRGYDLSYCELHPINGYKTDLFIDGVRYKEISFSFTPNIELKAVACKSAPNGVEDLKIVSFDPVLTVTLYLDSNEYELYHEGILRGKKVNILIKDNEGFGIYLAKGVIKSSLIEEDDIYKVQLEIRPIYQPNRKSFVIGVF